MASPLSPFRRRQSSDVESTPSHGDSEIEMQRIVGASETSAEPEAGADLVPVQNVPFLSFADLSMHERIVRVVPHALRGCMLSVLPRPSGDEIQAMRPVPNKVANHRYTLVTFVPKVLWDQFMKFFFNFFFLVLACSQAVPQLRVGPLITYLGPLAFVLICTFLKEAVQDLSRHRRDAECNGARYERVAHDGSLAEVRADDIRAGDV